jgi:hypothetical protein
LGVGGWPLAVSSSLMPALGPEFTSGRLDCIGLLEHGDVIGANRLL